METDAEGEFKAALVIFRESGYPSSVAYKYDAATTLFNLGLVHGRMKRYDLSKEEWLEYIELYKDLPEAVQARLADRFEIARRAVGLAENLGGLVQKVRRLVSSLFKRR